MTIFDLAPLSSWRKARRTFKALAKSDFFDTQRMQMAMEVQRLYCKRLEAENAELRRALAAQNAEVDALWR
jgi:hypothetical protein